MLSDDLTAARDELAERLRLAAAAIGARQLVGLADDQKAKAAGVRGVLAKIGRETSQCRSTERLAELTARAERALDEARQIAADLAAERDRRERARSATALQRQQDAADRQRDRAMRQGQARAQRAQLGQVTAAARELERLYRRTTTRPAESPLAVLAARTVGGDPLITYQPRPQPPTRGGLRRLVTRPTPAGDWHVPGTAVSFPGRPGYCTALASWGPGTRAVLRPWLAALHSQEDHLCAVLGRGPRKRPAL